jgi:DNA-binding MarR family transcriptional regulator
MDNKKECSLSKVCGDMQQEGREELLAELRKCGRFLYHKFGGRHGQGKILRILAEKEELSQKELQDMLGIQSGSISEIINKLERRGLLYRVKDEADKRMTKLHITEEGLEELKEIEQRVIPGTEELFEVLKKEEQETLAELVKKLNASWELKYSMQGERIKDETIQ